MAVFNRYVINVSNHNAVAAVVVCNGRVSGIIDRLAVAYVQILATVTDTLTIAIS